MQRWQNIIVYAHAQGLGDGRWRWVASWGGLDYEDFDGVAGLLDELGRDGWELVSVMPVNWQGGETRAFQAFLKRPIG